MVVPIGTLGQTIYLHPVMHFKNILKKLFNQYLGFLRRYHLH